MAQSAVASRSVPRPPSKPKKGEPFRMHLLLAPELVELIDKFAEQLGAERDPASGLLHSDRTRSEATRILIAEGLRKRGLLK